MSIVTSRRPWRRRVFFLVVTIVAVGLGVLVAGGVAAWAAGGLGVVIGIGATLAMDEWDDRHAPDFAASFEERLK